MRLHPSRSSMIDGSGLRFLSAAIRTSKRQAVDFKSFSALAVSTEPDDDEGRNADEVSERHRTAEHEPGETIAWSNGPIVQRREIPCDCIECPE
jgi:hypothetical protein